MEFIRDPYEFLERNVTLASRTLAIAPQSPLKAGLHSRMIMVAVTYNPCSSAADWDEEDLDIKNTSIRDCNRQYETEHLNLNTENDGETESGGIQ